jgi:hypothetical protein
MRRTMRMKNRANLALTIYGRCIGGESAFARATYLVLPPPDTAWLGAKKFYNRLLNSAPVNGRLDSGYPADIALSYWKSPLCLRRMLRQLWPEHPYHGWMLRGQVKVTLCDGKVGCPW